jgi:hypothetical protein
MTSARAARRRRRGNPADGAADPAPRLDLAIIEEIAGLHWRVRSGRTILATGFADHEQAPSWLDSIIQLET